MEENRYEAGEHPSRDQLADFARGDIDEMLAFAIESHLADCADCLERLEGISPDDSWLDLLRDVGSPASKWGASGVGEPALPSGYALESVIGRGGMGVVHRARQLGLDRRVALKRIAAGRDASPQLVERFRREVEAAASLNHPAIVPIYDVGVLDGVPFYTMELLEGGSLADRLTGGPLRTSDAIELVGRLAWAVDHAHRQGIIHRDLKPSNILFDSEGAAKVADFGLAKRLEAEPDSATTRSSLLLGTPSYMAPEQAEGRPEAVGPAVDVYALGVLLFECLTGRPPFLAPTPLETLELIRAAEPPSPTRIRPGIPTDLGTICLNCLEKYPARRYPSAAALAEDLGRFARGETILARPAGPLERVAKWTRRRPYQAAFVALLALSLAGTIAGLLVHQSRLRAALDREARSAKEARRQRGIAESNYRDAHNAITRFLAILNDPQFGGTPRLAEVHRAQAEAGLAFYDQVLRRTGSDDPAIRSDTARAAVEAASLQISLGRAEPAEANLRRAMRLYDVLLARSPDDQALVRDQMIAHIKLGVLLLTSDAGRSVEVLEKALSLARRGSALSPADENPFEKDLAWCEHNLGSAWQLAQQPPKALPHFDRAVAIYGETLRKTPDNVGLRVELAQSLINQGLARAETGALVQAEASYREAEALLDQALSVQPGLTEYLASRCDLMLNWGNLDVALGRLQDGLGRYDQGLRSILTLLGEEPNLLRLKSTAINLHGARAVALEKAGRFGDATLDWDRVIALDDSSSFALGYALSRLLCLARGGDHLAVSTAAAPLEARSDLAAPDLYNLSCALALASTATPEAGPERLDLKERALKLLERALAGDPQLRDTARQDSDLRPLADEPAYRRAIDGP
ncbi:protein kinase domain-containing protein [Tundrisphaera lichenicola]|uniref:serine/threonine-protein kinase n=1 Tax=Tundrisphaera lichenicola TaxID=2029860 RepID=UPI003EB6DB89